MDFDASQEYNNNTGVAARTMTIEVPFKEHPERLTELTKTKLVSFMFLLHHVFFAQNKKGEDNAQTDNDLSSSVQLFKFALSDWSLVTRAIIALGSGHTVEKILPCNEESNVYSQSAFLAFWGHGAHTHTRLEGGLVRFDHHNV